MSLGLFGRAAGMQAPRLLGAWFDSERSGWAVWILLALFVVVWTAFHIISNAALDLHDDITEIYTWSRTLRPGYYKHPPLGALMAAPWFVLFPAADWSFRLFAMLNAALALFAVDLIARRYLSGDKRLLALLLLLLMPFYQFFSERFASNQTLLATWPLATYCFLRAFETRGFWWSAAAGVAAAAAMLGKYYSIYLIGSFVVAALAHPARWTYLRSPSPWISAVVGLLVLSPHIHWLIPQASSLSLTRSTFMVATPRPCWRGALSRTWPGPSLTWPCPLRSTLWWHGQAARRCSKCYGPRMHVDGCWWCCSLGRFCCRH